MIKNKGINYLLNFIFYITLSTTSFAGHITIFDIEEAVPDKVNVGRNVRSIYRLVSIDFEKAPNEESLGLLPQNPLGVITRRQKVDVGWSDSPGSLAYLVCEGALPLYITTSGIRNTEDQNYISTFFNKIYNDFGNDFFPNSIVSSINSESKKQENY